MFVDAAKPDSTVCHHLLLYRDLLQSPCGEGTTFWWERKPPLEYKGAADAIANLPWWKTVEGGVPVLSYDDLLSRLWESGVVRPYRGIDEFNGAKAALAVPHEHWVSRLGFQEADPGTDFRSGGLLGLACLVYVVESRPDLRRRFAAPDGDVTGILPLAGTSINVSNMISDILMLKQSVNSPEAQPFWDAFLDPVALLVLQGLCMDILADVVVKMGEERRREMAEHEERGEEAFEDEEDEMPSHGGKVTAFDFPVILERTKQKVEDDLLGSGPEFLRMATNSAKKLQNQVAATGGVIVEKSK